MLTKLSRHPSRNAVLLALTITVGWLLPQSEMTAQRLADLITSMDRGTLLQRAQAAKNMQQLHATDAVVAACEELNT